METEGKHNKNKNYDLSKRWKDSCKSTFHYNNLELEIVSTFSYLGIVFSSGGSFSKAQTTLSGQAQKAIFKLNKYLYKFTNLSPKHILDLFDKLVVPILNYGGEVWGFSQANQIERVHLKFCKRLLGVKLSTQNDFIYGELGRKTMQTNRLYTIVKYWFKILQVSDRKFINSIYKMMLSDIEERPNKQNWAALVRNLLSELGFYHVWLAQGVGNVNSFLIAFKQRLHDNFVQNWNSRLQESSRSIFYRHIAVFQYQPYLDIIAIGKYRSSLTKLRVCSHRLAVETGRWHRPNRIPFRTEYVICAIR